MSESNVHQFACGHAGYVRGRPVACERQRHHVGDHRGRLADGQLATWPDPPYVPEGEPVLDESDAAEHDTFETVLEGRAPFGGPWALVTYLELALLVLLVLCSPAIVAAVWRAGF